jgi:NADH:ubiquinone oxidoreductase subunit C
LRSILSGHNFFFIENCGQRSGYSDIFLGAPSLYYLSLHFRLSSLFYLSQLTDIFAYEAFVNLRGYAPSSDSNFFKKSKLSKSLTSVVVYNFHVLSSQHRIFIFSSNFLPNGSSTSGGRGSFLFSVADLFSSANWLEREVSELSGVTFLGKKDLRNLMLQYGDSSVPFQKSFPTVGLQEMFYNPIKDVLVQNPITLQI